MMIDEDAKCAACGLADPLAHSPEDTFVFCDGIGCNAGWHVGCAGDRRAPAPSEPWFCPFCRAEPEVIRVDPNDFRAMRRPQQDKRVKRIVAGLDSSQPPNLQDVEVVRAHARAPSTQTKRRGVVDAFQAFLSQRRFRPGPDALSMFLVGRLKTGISYGSIKREASILIQAVPASRPADSDLKDLLAGIERLAEVPSQAKEALRLDELHQLRRTIRAFPLNLSEAANEHVRVRDWATYLLMYFLIWGANGSRRQ